MRIATWNLESRVNPWPERDSAFRTAMSEVDADIWVLTETWIDYAPSVGFQLVAQTFGAKDLLYSANATKRCWVSIWAKSTLASTPQTVTHQPDRMASCRIHLPDHRDLVVVGTVLPWGSSDALWPATDGYCAALNDQAVGWNLLRTGVAPCDFVVAGDFNVHFTYKPSYGRKPERTLSEVLASQELQCLTLGNVPQTEKAAIDHFCMSRSSIQTRTPRVGTWPIPTSMGKPITDHHGVFADLI